MGLPIQATDVAPWDIEDEAGEASARDIAALDGAGKTAFFHCDVGYKANGDESFRAVLDRFEKVDILVSTAKQRAKLSRFQG